MPTIDIQSTSPARNALAVPKDQTIGIQFNNYTTLGSGSLILSNGQGDTRRIAIHDASQVKLIQSKGLPIMGIQDSSTLTINPHNDLLGNSSYYLLADAGVINDNAGQALPGITDPTAYRFSTTNDTRAPQLLSGSRYQGTNAFSLTFNESVKLTGLGKIKLTNTHGDARIIEVTSKDEGTGLSLRTDPLLSNTAYYLTIEANAITDGAGNPLLTTTLNYTTGDEGANFQPYEHNLTVDLEQRPLPANGNVTLKSLTYAIKAGSGYITISNGLGDTRRIAVNDSRQVKFPAEQRNTVMINPLVDLWPNSEYTLSVDPGALTDLVGDSYSIADEYAVSDYGNYFNTIAADTSPPLALSGSYSEQSGVISQGAGRYLSAKFNEALEVGKGNLTISNGQGDSHSIAINDTNQVALYDGNTSLEINIKQNLLPNTSYFVLADKEILTDRFGNPFAGVNSSAPFSFTTGPIAPALKQPVQEINHPGGVTGRYELGDRLVFSFNTPIKSYESFQLNRHSFGGNDLLLSADGLSAAVTLTIDSTVAPGDRLTFSGAEDHQGNRMTLFFDL